MAPGDSLPSGLSAGVHSRGTTSTNGGAAWGLGGTAFTMLVSRWGEKQILVSNVRNLSEIQTWSDIYTGEVDPDSKPVFSKPVSKMLWKPSFIYFTRAHRHQLTALCKAPREFSAGAMLFTGYLPLPGWLRYHLGWSEGSRDRRPGNSRVLSTALSGKLRDGSCGVERKSKWGDTDDQGRVRRRSCASCP